MGDETLITAIKSIPLLGDVPSGSEFILLNGDAIRSLLELQVKFVKMDDRIFHHHVTPDKNDFATWAYHTIGDTELARQLGPVKTKAQNLQILKDRVRQIVSEKVKFSK